MATPLSVRHGTAYCGLLVLPQEDFPALIQHLSSRGVPVLVHWLHGFVCVRVQVHVIVITALQCVHGCVECACIGVCMGAYMHVCGIILVGTSVFQEDLVGFDLQLCQKQFCTQLHQY